MKKTRLKSLLVILITLALTLGAAVGIYAAITADTGSAEVIAKNVSYEAELSLVFAVNSANVQDGDTVYLLIWNAQRADGDYTFDNANTVKESFGTDTVNGYANALLFKTDKIAVDNLQHKFYIRTCIVRGEAKIYGEVFDYSVEDYALQRLSEPNVTPDQAELYYNVLRYALAADKVLNEGAQVEDNYIIFAADGMTFGTQGAKIATMYGGVVPFDRESCVVTDAAGNVVNINGELTPGIYTVSFCEHTYASFWTSDSVGHWHSATCTHTELKKDYAEHTAPNGNGLCDSCGFDIQAYIDATLTASSNAAFANRWNEAETKMGADAANALKELYDFYGTDWFDWLLTLYDAETGCFYYANSARDYEGFLVDVESTCQTLDMFFNSGVFDTLGKVWAKTIPEDMRAKCLAYVQSLQDPDDGYFYHPQWGKSIGSSRRGRDLDQSLTLITRMGGSPLYSTPLDNSEVAATSAVISAFMDTDAHRSSVMAVADARFESEEGMKAYLDGLVETYTDSDGYFDSYSFGHTLSSETSQIKAAGLGDYVCSYIDTLQDPETGFYEVMNPSNAKAGYRAASGVIKISAFYSSVNGAIKYGHLMIDSLIEIILSDVKTEQITFVFNPIGALSAAISSVKQANSNGASYDLRGIRENLYARLPDIVDKTIEKLSGYKHEDGSFSYYENGRSLVRSQGVISSLGYDEGDVNGTACAMHYILGSLYSALGISRVPMLTYTDYITFREHVGSAAPIVKSPVPDVNVDFEAYTGYDMPPEVSGKSEASLTDGEVLEIVEMTQLDGTVGNVIRMDSVSGVNNWINVDAKSAYGTLAYFSVSFDLYVDSAAASQTHQIFLRNSATNRSAYMLELVSDGTKVYLRDASTDAYIDTKFKTTLGVEENLDTWMNVKLEYYVINDTDTGKTIAKIKVYKNGTCVTISDNYFVNNTSANTGFFNGTAERPSAMTSIDSVYIYALKAPVSSVRFDNIKCVPKDSSEFSDTGVDPYAGGIFGTGAVRNNTLTFEDGAMPSAITSITTGFGALETVAKGTDTDNTALKLVSAQGKQESMKITLANTLESTACFVFEADVRLDSADTDYTHQIVFNNGNAGVFMLALGLSGTTVKVQTDKSTSSSSPTNLNVNATAGEWFTLKIEYYPVDDTTAYIKAYKNGVFTGESTQYYNKGSADVQYTVTSMTMWTRVSPTSTLYLDDVRFTFEPNKNYN